MDGEIILKEDNNLLVMIKTIFGEELVKNAFIGVSGFKEEYEEEPSIIDKEFKTMQAKFNLDSSNYLCTDNTEIIIEFTNGRKISFSNSEWGGIQLIKETDIKYWRK